MRWGLPDALLCFVLGILAGDIVASVLVANRSARGLAGLTPVLLFAVVLPAQTLTQLGALAWISRAKGRGSLMADFGLKLAPQRVWLLLAGLGLQFALGITLLPILQLVGPDGPPQDLIRQAEKVQGPAYLAVALSAGFLAPLAEEVLFRGLLLRSLLRRMSATAAILVSALIFGLVHVPGNLSAAVGLPAFTGLGILLGAVAYSTGSLTGPVFLHAGFNLATVLLLFLQS